MKRIIALALLLMAGVAQAAQPTDADVAAYTTRMNLYVSLGQTPAQVAVSLCNYFGQGLFTTVSYSGWTQTVDIVVQQGTGTEITFLRTLGTMKVVN